jgi:hypothetical protein
MRLFGGDGHGVELTVVGYQFPDAVHPGQRQSWLIVEGAARCRRGAWSFRWPALTADDAVLLADWLRSMAGEQSSGGLEFTEPNLAFAGTRSGTNQVDLQIDLDLEFSPPWRLRTRSGDPFTLSFQVTPEAILRAAAEWADEIAPYPPWNRSTPS